MDAKIKIGIIGCGFIGTALNEWLKQNNTLVETRVSDPPKGMNDDLSNCDAYFIQIHLPTEVDGTQNTQMLESIVARLPDGKPIWIRTTILPGTSAMLSKKTGKTVYHMPEFLTQRTYLEDFKWQPMVFTGSEEHIKLLKKIFPGKTHIDMTSEEAEMTKYAHNVFGAMKVTYFNCIYDLCQKRGLDYSRVREGMLASTYINDVHTQVPGPDGQFGYGGKCFPKDVDAFEKMFRYTPLGRLIQSLKPLNAELRNSQLLT